ncbi:HCLS1-associated protein X-1 [Venturia canescens]|uniref:HCLS1-associated protein X-1 n=1 Tax=Venturia canescens TaxID=32260 RepID=UPI001C9C34E9|nr:HCLS1-associated protein X-1 [Venturia canescens]
MSIFDTFFQKLFGRRNNHQPPNQDFEDHRQYGDRFRNPIWQTDDDDDDEAGDFRHPGTGMHFSVFSDPVEMTRYFESQMDNMLKNFFHGFGQGFGNAIENFEDNGSLPALPAPQPKSLRESFLKPGYEYPQSKESGAPKLDHDLDGQLSAADLTKVWKEPDSVEPRQSQMPHSQFSFRSFGKSMSTQMIRQPDGTIEQRQTITDSDGNTETIITRQFGDKTHTIKTRRDKNGVETKTEDLINLDENQLADFEKKWQPVEGPKIESGTLSSFPWHKYFNFNPKL